LDLKERFHVLQRVGAECGEVYIRDLPLLQSIFRPNPYLRLWVNSWCDAILGEKSPLQNSGYEAGFREVSHEKL
ncbi:MAG: hypothetical protein ACRD8U_20170, partial [Pyrinomonadaceae bacterium]